jgi:membrane protein required for colicin V production
MILDLVVLGILFVSAAVAFMRGFVREVLTIGSLAGAAIATLAFGSSLTPTVRGWIVDPSIEAPQLLFNLVPYEMVAPVVSYGIVFVLTLIVLTIITHLISKGVHAAGLGPVDRSLGVVFGLVRGVIVIGLISLVMNFVLNDTQRETFFADSKVYPYVSSLADLTQALLPGRDVLGKKDHAKAIEDIGKQPLEPGQQSGQSKRSGGTQKHVKPEETPAEAQAERPRRNLQFNN